MTIPAILLPVFAQVALIFGLLMLMAGRRFRAVREREVRRDDVSMGEKAWPAAAQRASNAFSNQFELPVLFLVLVPLAIVTRRADEMFVVLSWLFVLTRFVHAGVYVTTNRVPHRFSAFLAGTVVLMIMWVVFAARILSTPLPA